MSVSSTTNKIIYTGSGTTGPFDFDFRIFESSDLVVEKFTIATGATVELTETTDYSVTIDTDGTGYVTAVAAVTSSYKLIIRRVLPLTQEIDYVEGDKFPAETHEEGLDRGLMVSQQIQEQIDRAVLQNPTVSTQITLPGAVTGNGLIWDADGNLVNSDTALIGPTGPTGPTGPAGADGVFAAIASQEEAEAGTDNEKGMTALRVAQAIAALGFDGLLTDYADTSTITGWSTFSSKYIGYLKIGKMVFVSFTIVGESNATGCSFTLPYALASTGESGLIGYAYDNNAEVTTACRFIVRTSTVTLYKGMGTDAWTNSGGKHCIGLFWYRTT